MSDHMHHVFDLLLRTEVARCAMPQIVFTVCFGCGLDVDFNETDAHGVCPDCLAYEAQCAAEFRDDD